MKDSVVQRVNPYIVRKSCILAFLTASPIIWAGTILFYVMVFVMTLASER